MPTPEEESLLKRHLSIDGDGNVLGDDNTVKITKQSAGDYAVQIGQKHITFNIADLRRVLEIEHSQVGVIGDQPHIEGGIHYHTVIYQQSPEHSMALDSAGYTAARDRYLSVLRDRYNVIETHAFTALSHDIEAGHPRRLTLLGQDSVYVPLLFDIATGPQRHRMERPELSEELLERTSPADLATVLQTPGHLAIIGDAGSGKTTVLHVILSLLSAENPATLDPTIAESLPSPRPLPVFLPLRLFEQACLPENANGSCYVHCAADLLRFVDDWFAAWCPHADLPPGFLAEHIRTGQAWFLLDALDEVADLGHRQTVRNVIEDLAGELVGTRMIVTARVAAYRNTQLNNRFTVVNVRDLDADQRGQMVSAIYRGLALENAVRRADELAQRFEESPALQELGRTPVMVWTASVIHALRGELPEGRAALYDAYVEILLKQSFKRARYDVQAVDNLSEGQGWTLADRRHYLTYAAFKVHELLESQPERRGERRVVVGEDELLDEILAPYFCENLRLSIRDARRQAREFVALMVERSGLLYESEQGYMLGDHLTMQEFLAAYYLAENYALEDPAGYVEFLSASIDRTWWREVLLLAVGYLGQKPGFQGRKFLLKLASQGETPAVQLASLSLTGRGLLQLRSGRKRPKWYAGVAQDLANRLYQALYAQTVAAPVPVRQEAGLVLGLLYGYPDGGFSAADLADPRFAGPFSLPRFVKIPAGTFWMGSTEEEVAHWVKVTGEDYPKRELPRHKVTLSVYEIARYPVTNAMYSHFIADEGYNNPAWWEAAIADGKWKDGRVREWLGDWYSLPRYWDDLRWNNPSQPVVGVNWYEAVAYCNWLTAQLGDDYSYRLPTEAEWERAARGPAGHCYPWGDQWHEDYCNSKDVGLEVTSPVGLFPSGASQEDLLDMVGNVWEWCQDWYSEDYYARSQDAHNPGGPESGSSRVLRGGSWYNPGSSVCRCGCRNWFNPGGRDYNWGFRCVRILS